MEVERVLVADSSVAVRKMFELVAQDLHLELCFPGDEEELFSEIPEFKPQAMYLDQRFGKGGAAALLPRLRELAIEVAPPLVLMSTEPEHSLMDGEAYGFLRKPFDSRSLEKSLIETEEMPSVSRRPVVEAPAEPVVPESPPPVAESEPAASEEITVPVASDAAPMESVEDDILEGITDLPDVDLDQPTRTELDQEFAELEADLERLAPTDIEETTPIWSSSEAATTLDSLLSTELWEQEDEKAASTLESTMNEDPQNDMTLEPSNTESGRAESRKTLRLDPEQFDELVKQVVSQISDQVVREIAWEVIPDMAELLIRQAIERLEQESSS